MSSETCKQTVNNCKFPADLKQRLLLILPLLEKHTMDGLEKELSRGDSVLIQVFLTSTWENFARLLKGIKANDSKALQLFWEEFKEKQNLLNDEDKVYFLYLVMDVFKLSWLKKNAFNENEKIALLEFEIGLFNYLPKEEIVALLGNYLIFIAKKWDLLKAVQIVIVDNFWDEDNKFLVECSKSLLKNKETIGSIKPRSIEQWVLEFTNFSPTPISERGSYQITDFFVKNNSVKELSEEEKVFLTEVLKLFLWFANPEVNTQELDDYKKQLERQKAEYERKLYEAETGYVADDLENEIIKKPVLPRVPVPKNVFAQREMGEISRISNDKLQISNVSPPPSLPPAGGGIKQNEKTADGSAIDSLIVKNQTGAGGSLAGAKPLTSTQNQSSDSGSGRATLQEKIYQGNNNEASGNKKAAPFGAALGFQQVPESLALTSENSISESQSLSTPQDTSGSSSGGPKGNRTPETRMSKPGSAPAWAHSNELYHSSAQVGQNRVNNQDVLKDRKSSSFILNPLLEKKPVLPQSGQSKQAEINRKLEELKRKIKN